MRDHKAFAKICWEFRVNMPFRHYPHKESFTRTDKGKQREFWYLTLPANVQSIDAQKGRLDIRLHIQGLKEPDCRPLKSWLVISHTDRQSQPKLCG